MSNPPYTVWPVCRLEYGRYGGISLSSDDGKTLFMCNNKDVATIVVGTSLFVLEHLPRTSLRLSMYDLAIKKNARSALPDMQSMRKDKGKDKDKDKEGEGDFMESVKEEIEWLRAYDPQAYIPEALLSSLLAEDHTIQRQEREYDQSIGNLIVKTHIGNAQVLAYVGDEDGAVFLITRIYDHFVIEEEWPLWQASEKDEPGASMAFDLGTPIKNIEMGQDFGQRWIVVWTVAKILLIRIFDSGSQSVKLEYDICILDEGIGGTIISVAVKFCCDETYRLEVLFTTGRIYSWTSTNGFVLKAENTKFTSIAKAFSPCLSIIAEESEICVYNDLNKGTADYIKRLEVELEKGEKILRLVTLQSKPYLTAVSTTNAIFLLDTRNFASPVLFCWNSRFLFGPLHYLRMWEGKDDLIIIAAWKLDGTAFLFLIEMVGEGRLPITQTPAKIEMRLKDCRAELIGIDISMNEPDQRQISYSKDSLQFGTLFAAWSDGCVTYAPIAICRSSSNSRLVNLDKNVTLAHLPMHPEIRADDQRHVQYTSIYALLFGAKMKVLQWREVRVNEKLKRNMMKFGLLPKGSREGQIKRPKWLVDRVEECIKTESGVESLVKKSPLSKLAEALNRRWQ